MFLNDACCDPAIDSQIQTYYEELIYVSDLCASKHTQTHTSLQYLFCLACHPKQFKFTNETTQVIKVCPSIAHDADPAGFDGCGVNLPGARGDLCSGGSPVNLYFIMIYLCIYSFVYSFIYLFIRLFQVIIILKIKKRELIYF